MEKGYSNPKGVLTRYLIGHDTSRMNVLLDWKMPRGTKFTLKDDDKVWTVIERYETLEARQINRGWNNNI